MGNPHDVTLFNVYQIVSLPVTEVHIQTATHRDPVLGTVLWHTQQGWPSEIREHLRPYWMKRNELTIEKGILLWGIRVIVPSKLKDQELQEIHLTQTE